MNTEASLNGQVNAQVDILNDAILHITSLPKRQYTQQEIDDARGNLALMNDRVFLVTGRTRPWYDW